MDVTDGKRKKSFWRVLEGTGFALLAYTWPLKSLVQDSQTLDYIADHMFMQCHRASSEIRRD